MLLLASFLLFKQTLNIEKSGMILLWTSLL